MNKNNITRLLIGGQNQEDVEDMIDDMENKKDIEKKMARERKREINKAKAQKNGGRK